MAQIYIYENVRIQNRTYSNLRKFVVFEGFTVNLKGIEVIL